MEKGKLGIRVAFYGVAGFAAAIMGNFTILALVLGVVLLVEKNEWAARQVLQAAALLMLASLVNAVLNVLTLADWISWVDDEYYNNFLYRAGNRLDTIISFATGVVIDVFAFLSILKNVKGEDANVPFASNFANWAYGLVTVKPQVVPAQNAQPVQPVAPQAAPAANNCTNCGAPLNGAAFCTKCGTPAAK